MLLKIGTTGVAAHTLSALKGVIPQGERVVIVGIDPVEPSWGYEVQSLVTGLHLIECGFDCVIPDAEETDSK